MMNNKVHAGSASPQQQGRARGTIYIPEDADALNQTARHFDELRSQFSGDDATLDMQDFCSLEKEDASDLMMQISGAANKSMLRRLWQQSNPGRKLNFNIIIFINLLL
jgi:hypothetical protein